jgi:hypothetical protein
MKEFKKKKFMEPEFTTAFHLPLSNINVITAYIAFLLVVTRSNLETTHTFIV